MFVLEYWALPKSNFNREGPTGRWNCKAIKSNRLFVFLAQWLSNPVIF